MALRKDKVFSVSMVHDEVLEVDKHLAALVAKTGMELSRNEFIRRSVLAHVRYSRNKSGSKYMDVFKTAGICKEENKPARQAKSKDKSAKKKGS